MFRPCPPEGMPIPYHHDHQSARQVADLAQRTNCGIFVTNHNRKAEALDWTAEASRHQRPDRRSADTVCTLMRKRGQADAVMKITGRDIDEQELAMSFKGGLWTILGNAAVNSASKRDPLPKETKLLGFHGGIRPRRGPDRRRSGPHLPVELRR